MRVALLRKKSRTRTTFPRVMSSNFSEEEGEEVSKIDSKDHYKRRVQFVDNHLCSSSSSSSSRGKKKGVLFYFTSKSSKKIN